MAIDEVFPLETNYFDYLSSHKELLEDKVRTGAYGKAIKNTVNKDDVVLDIGTGLGILAYFCVKSGAKKVYAIEKSEIVELAREIANKNYVDNKIEFIKGDSREVELPEKVDLIVTETLGHLGIEEGIAEMLVDARKRFLKKCGRIIPQEIKVYLAPVEAPKFYEEIEFWNNKNHGIDLSVARKRAVNNVYVYNVKANGLLATPKIMVCFDSLNQDRKSVSKDVDFIVNKEGILHGYASWFEARLSDKVAFSTHFCSRRTHWQQAIFPSSAPRKVRRGEHISFHLRRLS